MEAWLPSIPEIKDFREDEQQTCAAPRTEVELVGTDKEVERVVNRNRRKRHRASRGTDDV